MVDGKLKILFYRVAKLLLDGELIVKNLG